MTATAKHPAAQLIPTLSELRRLAISLEIEHADDILAVPEHLRDSARNLLHYLSLRQRDLGDLRQGLAMLGLSRLANAEAHTLGGIDAVLTALHALVGDPPSARIGGEGVAIGAGEALSRDQARGLLGDPAGGHDTRIMVTLPSEAANQPRLLRDLLVAGMNIARIDCAHDDADAWLAMIRHLREAERATGLTCRIQADLAGPKLRTGAIESIGRLVEFKTERDTWGRVTAPARVWLTRRGQPEPPCLDVDATLPLDDSLLGAAHAGDTLDVDDSRGSRRHLRLKERFGDSWLAVCFQRGFIPDGSDCHLYRGDALVSRGHVGPLPEVCIPILLHIGDKLLVTTDTQAGMMARHDEVGRLIQPASIPCSLDAVFDAALPGEAIWFDDGRIGGRILNNRNGLITAEITHAAPHGSKLRPDKGINLPDTDLDIPALTERDKIDLDILADHVDMVGLSFARHPDDLTALHAELELLGATHLGTVIKIETRQAFERLPEILLAGLRHPPMGVMVARGDLAVEVGFERLSEVQDEILRLCMAAHVPAIWATQVLETMTKRGIPGRAEVSDAALSGRAECVMLNKGPYVVEATRFLNDVLTRMSGPKLKRQPAMRRLAASGLPAGMPDQPASVAVIPMSNRGHGPVITAI